MLVSFGRSRHCPVSRCGRSVTVTGARHSVTPGVTESHPRGDRESPNDKREGKSVSTKIFKASVQTIDPSEPKAEPKNKGKKEVFLYSLFPSQEQEREKAPVPQASEPVFQHRKQVGMLYSVARKLNYTLSDDEVLRFDALEHTRKKVILDRLLAEEQEAALRGEVESPPKKPQKPRATRAGVISERKPKPERVCVGQHRWTPVADDGIRNCIYCAAELGAGK